MKRRDIIKYTVYVTGTALSIPLATSILTGCNIDQSLQNYQPRFFNAEQMLELKNLVDLILPKTESPAASEVGVHNTIDAMTVIYDNEKLTTFKEGFNELILYLNQQSNDGQFSHLPKGEQLQILKSMENSQVKLKSKETFIEIKQQTIAYYLKSEEIALNFLNYDPIPGEYIGCIPLSQVNGIAWAE